MGHDFPIGRLDKDSQGLIFLTNNGDLVNKILRANNNHEKEYQVTVNKPITEEFVEGMRKGCADSWPGHQEVPGEESVHFCVYCHASAGVKWSDTRDVRSQL